MCGSVRNVLWASSMACLRISIGGWGSWPGPENFVPLQVCSVRHIPGWTKLPAVGNMDEQTIAGAEEVFKSVGLMTPVQSLGVVHADIERTIEFGSISSVMKGVVRRLLEAAQPKAVPTQPDRPAQAQGDSGNTQKGTSALSMSGMATIINGQTTLAHAIQVAMEAPTAEVDIEDVLKRRMGTPFKGPRPEHRTDMKLFQGFEAARVTADAAG